MAWFQSAVARASMQAQGFDARPFYSDDRDRCGRRAHAAFFNTPAGLASSLRLAGTGTQEPLWDRLAEIRCPVLVVVGENDAKFTDLGRRLVDGLADARLEIVADSGHSVHLEAPDATAVAIADFIG